MIINVASVAAYEGQIGQVAYSASKVSSSYDISHKMREEWFP